MGRDNEVFKILERCVDSDGQTSGLVILSNAGVKSVAGMEQISYLLGQRKILNYFGKITKEDIDILPFNGNTVGIGCLPVVSVGIDTVTAIKRYKNGRNLEGFGVVSKDGNEVYVGKDEAAQMCRDGLIDNISVQNCNGSNVFRGKGISLEDLETVQKGETEKCEVGISKGEVLNIFNREIASCLIDSKGVEVKRTTDKNGKSYFWRLNKKNSHEIKNISIVLNFRDTVPNLGGELELIFMSGGIEGYRRIFPAGEEECRVEADKLKGMIPHSLEYTDELESGSENKYLELISNISNSIANRLRSQLYNGYSNGIMKSKHSNKVGTEGILSYIELLLIDKTIIRVRLENDCKNNNFKLAGVVDSIGTSYSIKKEVYQFSNQSVDKCAKDIALVFIGSGILNKVGTENSTVDSVYLTDKFKTSLRYIRSFLIDDINGRYSANISALNIIELGNDSGKLTARLKIQLSDGNMAEFSIQGLSEGIQLCDVRSKNGKDELTENGKIYEFKSIGAAKLTSDLIEELIRLKVISVET